jgi:putative GTP pyrophosphokinase
VPPPADVFKPDPGTSFSKRQVDKAGRRVLTFLESDIPADQVWNRFDPDEIVTAYQAVTWWRSLHARPLTKVAANLRYHVAKEGALVEGRIDVTQRLKRRLTIIDKLQREPTMEVTQMHDIGGVRARLPTLSHVYAVSRRLKKSWTIHRTRDYIANPKPSGYRALHHIVQRDGYKIEVQLRTELQDAWANQVEDDGRHTRLGFKFGQGPADVHGYYVAVSEAFAYMDRGQRIPIDLVSTLNARYENIRGILPR